MQTWSLRQPKQRVQCGQRQRGGEVQSKHVPLQEQSIKSTEISKEETRVDTSPPTPQPSSLWNSYFATDTRFKRFLIVSL